MINIVSQKGESYSFDPSTLRVFKDGVVLSSSKVEPVYTSSSNGMPSFSGLYLKDKGSILNMAGIEKQVITDINLVD